MYLFQVLVTVVFAIMVFEAAVYDDLTEGSLTCNTSRCTCVGLNRSVINCHFMDETYVLPTYVSTGLGEMKIYGKNFSVYIPDKTYDASWSAIKSLEIYGDSKIKASMQLPYSFTSMLGGTKTMIMQNAGLVSIETSAFANMTNMKYLDMSHNKFFHMDTISRAFKGYASNALETLILSGSSNANEKKKIYWTNHFNLSRTLTNLRHLDLSWTGTSSLYTLNTDSHIFPNLVTLDLTGTHIYQPISCINLFSYKKLEVLRMNNWPLSTPNKTVAKNCDFVFSQNGCYILPPNLKELHLSHFAVEKFDTDFKKDVCISSNLEYLSIPYLKVDISLRTITGLHNLKSLDISHIQTLLSTRIFMDMPLVETINASSNLLHKNENDPGFEQLFEKNNNLCWIDISNNGLQVIPFNFFSQNIHLESIDLSWNRLQSLKLNLTACMQLRRLSLAYNRIKYIDFSVLSHLDNIQSYNNNTNDTVIVSLERNGLSCSCESNEFLAWIQNTSVSIKQKENIVCEAELGKEFVVNYDTTYLKQNCLNNSSEPFQLSNQTELPYIVGGTLVSVLLAATAILSVFIFIKKRKNICKMKVEQDIDLEERIVSQEEDSQPHEIVDTNSPVQDNVYYIGLNESRFNCNDKKPHFAVFLAYSHNDRDFVISKLYRPLQKQLCELIPQWNERLVTVLYDKNFLPGQCTMDLCRAAIYSSCVTVAIVSDSFQRSTWCHYEIETAIEARVPIVPVYLPSCDPNSFPAVMKYIYENNVRISWPTTTEEGANLSQEETTVVRDLAFSVSTYVKQQIANPT